MFSQSRVMPRHPDDLALPVGVPWNPPLSIGPGDRSTWMSPNVCWPLQLYAEVAQLALEPIERRGAVSHSSRRRPLLEAVCGERSCGLADVPLHGVQADVGA